MISCPQLFLIGEKLRLSRHFGLPVSLYERGGNVLLVVVVIRYCAGCKVVEAYGFPVKGARAHQQPTANSEAVVVIYNTRGGYNFIVQGDSGLVE